MNYIPCVWGFVGCGPFDGGQHASTLDLRVTARFTGTHPGNRHVYEAVTTSDVEDRVLRYQGIAP